MDEFVLQALALGKRYRLRSAKPQPWTTALRRRFFGRGEQGPPTYDSQHREFWALRNVSFEVRRGEVLGFVGRNGAGKSTLLKILSGIVEPTTGRAIVHGRVGSLLELGVGFHPELTGRQNAFLNGAIHGFTRSQMNARIDEIVQFAEIDRFIDAPVKHYSSGMYVRLAFAVAAHLDPEFLIVDEVLAAGDAAFQRKSLEKIRELTGAGRTVLFVSHNLRAVQSMCSRAILLEGGEKLADGAPEDVIADYLRVINADRVGTGAPSPLGHSNLFHLSRVLDHRNVPARSIVIPWKSPISVSLEMDALEDVEQAVLGVGIITEELQPILYTYHTDDGSPPVAIRKGPFAFRVSLAGNLRPGKYLLHCIVRRFTTGEPVFSDTRAAELEIMDFSASGEREYEFKAGPINGIGNWQIGDEALTA